MYKTEEKCRLYNMYLFSLLPKHILENYNSNLS